MSRSEHVSPVIEPADLLTTEELAARLKTGKSWIYSQTKRSARRKTSNPMPVIFMGRYRRFSWKQICAWLETKSAKGGAR